MDFDLSADHRALQAAARAWFTQEWDIAALRDALDGQPVPDLTPSLAELGFLGILSSGGTVLDLALVAQEAGRVLAPVPLAGTAARAVTLLMAAGPHPLLDAVTTGQARVAVLDGPFTADEHDGQLHVTGTAALALDAHSASTLLVLATLPDGHERVLAVGPTQGTTILDRPALDTSRDLAGVTLTSATAQALDLRSPRATWDHALHVATVVLAAEDLGALERTLEATVEYALERETFGRKIGSYQAVKHTCVDMFVEQELIRSLVWLAAWTADENPEELQINALCARSMAAGALEKATESMIQIHGGIGFTWEHDAHLYWRRAKAGRSLLGDIQTHRDTIATLALAAAPA